MESQLEAVRQEIRSAKDEIVEVKQELAIAKQAGNKGGEKEVRFLRGRLEKLDSQMLSLNEKENILLRSQAPGKQCLELVLACDVIVLHSISVNNSVSAAFTHDPKGCCQDSHNSGQRKGLRDKAVCNLHALCTLPSGADSAMLCMS